MNTPSLYIRIKKYFTILLAVITVSFTTACETVTCSKCGGDGEINETVVGTYTDAYGNEIERISYYDCDKCNGTGSITQPNALGKLLIVLSFVGIIIAAAADN